MQAPPSNHSNEFPEPLPLRILIVNYEFPPLGGGGGIVSAWLAEELAKRHEVTVLTSRAFDLPQEEVRGKLRILRVPTAFRSQKMVANLPSMALFVFNGIRVGRSLVEKEDFDIINTHFAVPTGPVGMALSEKAWIPNVLSIHGGDLYDPSKWSSPHRHALLRKTVHRVVSRANVVVGQSKNTNHNLRQYFSSESQPEVIPLGIPRPPRSRPDRAKLGLHQDDFLMISVGRLVRRKRTDELVHLLRHIDRPGCRLIVVGDGPEESRVRKIAHRLGVDDRVVLTGFVDDRTKSDLLAASDVFVSASQHEGFGLVFLEAMAQGLPVVCYDNGGQTDYLNHELNGMVVPLNDANGMLKAVRSLFDDRNLKNTIRRRNLSDIEALFIESSAQKYERLFYDCIAP